MNIVLLESLGVSSTAMDEFEKTLTSLGHSFKKYERTDDIDLLKERTKDAEILIIANMPLTKEVINACDKLKFINIAFTGVDHVDTLAAKSKGILISNASGYSTESVAELTIGLMINLLRNIYETQINCRNGLTKAGLVGNLLNGKTVGIIGTGKIGLQVANILKAFGCNVLGYRRNPDQTDGINYTSLENLLAKSDIVTLHCPANSSTKDLINKDTLALMKPSAILINTARGSVVNQEDLSNALNSNMIRAAGIDVFDIEPPLPKNHILLTTKNILVTPHIAFATDESMIKRLDIVLDNIIHYLNNNQINII